MHTYNERTNGRGGGATRAARRIACRRSPARHIASLALLVSLAVSAVPPEEVPPATTSSAPPPHPAALKPVQQHEPGFMTNLYDISLALTTTLLLSALWWSVALRRRVAEQTVRIRLQLEREAMLEKKYRELFEQANDIVFSLDPTGHFQTLNKSGERVFGCSRRDSRQLTLGEFVAPEYAQALKDWMAACLSGTTPAVVELEVLRRDRVRSSLEISTQIVRQDGRVTGVQGIARDITERKQAEIALRQSEERFASAFRASPVAIAVTCLTDGSYIDVNESFLRLFGYKREEVVGHTCESLDVWTKARDREKFERMLRQRKSVGGAECDFRVKTGEIRKTLLFAEPIDLGNTPCALTIVHDMTDRLALEEKLRKAMKLEAVGRLAAGVAHDFNNLLTVIQGNADMALYRNSQNPAVAKALDRIAEASRRAANLTRQLLTFSRRQTPQPKPLDLNEVINGATRMFKHLLREDLTVRFKFAPRLPITNADPTMIEQVIINLVVNARDAMPKGGELSIETQCRQIDEDYVRLHPEASSPGFYVCLSVTDTGVGMDPGTLASIFEPFFTTKEVGKGTGLGLATVYGIVKQHKGWLEVTSEPGKGSSFNVFFPCDKPAESSPQDSGEPLTEFLEERKTILIVEDEPAVAEVAHTVLQEEGYLVLEANDGLGALQIWNDHRGQIDLLLTDIKMPHGMSGLDLADNLKALKPELQVIYTSGCSPEKLHPEIRPGTENFLAKPFSPAHLQQIVRIRLSLPPLQPARACHE